MLRPPPVRLAALLLAALALFATACGSETEEPSATAVHAAQPVAEAADAADAEQPTVTVPTSAPLSTPTVAVADATTAVVTEPTSSPQAAEPSRPAAPIGRTAPDVAATAQGLADQVAQAEMGLADPATTPKRRAEWGHLHQVAIRKLGYNPDWDVPFFEALPAEFRARTLLHVSARRALIDLSSGYDAADFIPAWQIVDPEPAAALLSFYKTAEDATGIEWEYLAAINLVETGMGRIRGLSSAGAQGPMQFLPTTWAESGIGEGDINDPSDAINAAARYLVRRGGPTDMPGAIWGYNNSDDYVTAVQAYAELLRQDESAYEAIYNWEIYFFTEAGDVWLPSGFSTPESIDLDDFLLANPWSQPDPGLR